MLAQTVLSQSHRSGNTGSANNSTDVTRVGQFMRLNPLVFNGSKTKEYPQYFFDKMENIFRVMYANNTKGVELVAYQLKGLAYQQYDELEEIKGGYVKPEVWEDFFQDLFDHLFPQELRKDKSEEFVNLKQGKIYVKEYELKFTKLSYYASKLVSNMQTRMRKFLIIY